MDPFNIVLTGWQGVPVPYAITVWTTAPAADGSGGVARDISNWIFMYTLKRSYSDTDDQAVYKKDWQVAPGTINGKQNFEVPDSITQNMQPNTYVWDLKTILPGTSGEPQMLLAGTLGMRKTVGQRITPVLS
jgi:hypothetical protein